MTTTLYFVFFKLPFDCTTTQFRINDIILMHINNQVYKLLICKHDINICPTKTQNVGLCNISFAFSRLSNPFRNKVIIKYLFLISNFEFQFEINDFQFVTYAILYILLDSKCYFIFPKIFLLS